MNKETFGKLVSRVRGHVREHKGTYKDSGMAMVGGAIASVVHQKVVPSVDFLQTNAYAEPVLLAVGGHFLSAKHKAVGHGMLGVAGYLLAEKFMADVNKPSATKTGVKNVAYRESAAFEEASDPEASALINSAFTALPSGEAMAYVEEASGIRSTDATSDVVRTRSEAAVMDDSSYYGGDASDALDL